MSKNKDRYKDDYIVDPADLDILDELEVPKFEKINHKKKTGKHPGHGNKNVARKEKQE
jgi:hypothetical protein